MAVLVALAALAILVPLLKWVLGLFFGLFHLAAALLSLALIVGAIIFVAGLIRRLVRR